LYDLIKFLPVYNKYKYTISGEYRGVAPCIHGRPPIDQMHLKTDEKFARKCTIFA